MASGTQPTTPSPSSAFLESVVNECLRARRKFRKFASAHEAYAVLKEEVEEYWELVKKNEPTGSVKYYEELVQVAAVALMAYKEVHGDFN